MRDGGAVFVLIIFTGSSTMNFVKANVSDVLF